jgi:hypothetical protein
MTHARPGGSRQRSGEGRAEAENANYRAEPESIGAERRGSSRHSVRKLGKREMWENHNSRKVSESSNFLWKLGNSPILPLALHT